MQNDPLEQLIDEELDRARKEDELNERIDQLAADLEADEALRGDCGQERYEPCGCPLYECTCDEYEGTPEDALTDFVDSWSPVHGVILPEGHPDHDGYE